MDSLLWRDLVTSPVLIQPYFQKITRHALAMRFCVIIQVFRTGRKPALIIKHINHMHLTTSEHGNVVIECDHHYPKLLMLIMTITIHH